jgi:pimeloyl-ACP methyl ester carboxylesterase
MIHGAFCGGWVFDDWRTLFERAGYSTLAPTLRHHDGRSEPPAALATTSVLDYVRDIEALLDTLPSPPIVIGHSMGGLIAQIVASRRRLRALVLLAPSSPWGVLAATPFEYASAQALYLAGDFWNRSLAPTHWIAAAHTLDNVPEPERRRLLKKLVPESGRATFEIMHWPLDHTRATWCDPDAHRGPVLCLAGGSDRVNSPGTVRSVSRRYRNRARYAEVKGCSHWLIGEPGWERIAHLALDWLAAQDADTQSAKI